MNNINEMLQQIADKYREEFVCGRYEAFEMAMNEAYKLGREFQRNSDKSICLFHGNKELANVIKYNTSEDGYNADGMS